MPQSNGEIIKKKIGRPSKFREDMLLKTQEYIQTALANKDIPTMERLAIELDVNEDNLYDWAKAHPEFSQLTKKLKTVQKDWLIRRLFGRFNPVGSIFLLKAMHGVIETSRTELTGPGGQPIAIVGGMLQPRIKKVKEIKIENKQLTDTTIGK